MLSSLAMLLVFGPLASAWKSEVNAASADYVEITKRNLLQFYAKARERSLKKVTNNIRLREDRDLAL